MADHLPPPSYSQQDPVVSPRHSEEHISDPQIVLLPTVDAVNFQKGFLGAEGERAAIEGEIQVKGLEPTKWNRVYVSSVSRRNASNEICVQVHNLEDI